jgi:hypothetical protein
MPTDLTVIEAAPEPARLPHAIEVLKLAARLIAQTRTDGHVGIRSLVFGTLVFMSSFWARADC